MEPTRQQIIDRVIQEAHERRAVIITSEVAAEIVEQLHELEAYEQMRLEDMTLPQLEAKAEHIGRTRDTLSIEYRFYRDLIEVMQADASLATAGDAIARLAAA